MKHGMKTCVAYVMAVVLVLAIGSASEVRGKEKVSEFFNYSGYTRPEYTGYETYSQYVPAKDGTNLALVWYLPTGGTSTGPFPVIFTHAPYHYQAIDPTTGQLWPHYKIEAIEYFTSYGYAIAVADMRGSGASFGVRANFSRQLAEDGKDIVDWMADQSWCDGNIGMMGLSYLGWSQYATAAQKPEALKCIMPETIYFDEFNAYTHYPGGIRVRGSLFGPWGPTFFDKNLYIPSFPFKVFGCPATPIIDEDGDGELHDEIPLDLDGNGSFLEDYQLPENPPQYSDGNPRNHVYYHLTLQHMDNFFLVDDPLGFRDGQVMVGLDDTFSDLTPTDYPDRIAESGIPIYHLGGWADRYTRDTAQWFATLSETNPSRMMIAPNNHSSPGIVDGDPGPYWAYNGEDMEAVTKGYLMEKLRFFDRYLKGINNHIDKQKPVQIYVMNGEGWRAEKEWPLARQKMVPLYLSKKNRLTKRRRGNGADEYTVDFTHDARQDGTNASRFGGTWDGPHMRTDDDTKCLSYTMRGSLKKNIEVTGHPIVHLWVSSSADYGDIFVYLEEVDKDGNAFLVSDGQLRAGFAKLLPNEDMLAPDSMLDMLPDLPWHGFKASDYVDGIFAGSAVVELVIDMWPVSWVFREGSRIRVTIAGADWPNFTLHPMLSPSNDPNDPGNIVPEITIHRSSAYPSRIELPVIPPQSIKG